METVWWPWVKAKSTDSTIRGYRYTCKKHISRFYALQIDDIRLPQMQPWINGLDLEVNDDGEPVYSGKRIQGIFSILSSILELARLTDRYHCLDHRLVILPEVEDTVREDLLISKVHMLVAAAKGTEMEGPIWTGGYLGLRRNEVCGLKVPHVVLHESTATIRIQDNRQPQGETRKLKSKRKGTVKEVEVPKWMGEKLLSFAEPGAIYIFHYDGKPIHPDRITKQMPDLCKKAQIDPIEFRVLRAACRSNLKASGMEEVDIMRVLGHSSKKSSRTYQDRRPEIEASGFGRMMEL